MSKKTLQQVIMEELQAVLSEQTTNIFSAEELEGILQDPRTSEQAIQSLLMKARSLQDAGDQEGARASMRQAQQINQALSAPAPVTPMSPEQKADLQAQAPPIGPGADSAVEREASRRALDPGDLAVLDAGDLADLVGSFPPGSAEDLSINREVSRRQETPAAPVAPEVAYKDPKAGAGVAEPKPRRQSRASRFAQAAKTQLGGSSRDDYDNFYDELSKYGVEIDASRGGADYKFGAAHQDALAELNRRKDLLKQATASEPQSVPAPLGPDGEDRGDEPPWRRHVDAGRVADAFKSTQIDTPEDLGNILQAKENADILGPEGVAKFVAANKPGAPAIEPEMTPSQRQAASRLEKGDASGVGGTMGRAAADALRGLSESKKIDSDRMKLLAGIKRKDG